MIPVHQLVKKSDGEVVNVLYALHALTDTILNHIVGNKAKGRISKWVFQKSKACQNFRKTNISYPLIRTRTCVYQGVRNVCFSEISECFAFLEHPF